MTREPSGWVTNEKVMDAALAAWLLVVVVAVGLTVFAIVDRKRNVDDSSGDDD